MSMEGLFLRMSAKNHGAGAPWLIVINVIVYIWPIGQLVAFFNSFADAFFDNLGWIV